MDVKYCRIEKNGEYSIIGILADHLCKSKCKHYYTWLNSMDDFKGGETTFGKIPRLQKFYDKEMRYFCNTWKNKSMDRWMSHKYDDTLLEMQTFLQNQINALDIFEKKGVYKPILNSCLINKYESEINSIKPHRDSHDTFGTNPTVIGVSLGEERDILFKRIEYDPCNLKSIKPDYANPEEIRISLPHGSIMLMAGAVQKYFSHEIPKYSNGSKKKLRYSLTFREYI